MNPIEFKSYVKSIKSSFSSLGIKEKNYQLLKERLADVRSTRLQKFSKVKL